MATATCQIDIPTDELRAFCQRWKIREFALFGSALRDDFRPDSDVDVLVEFEPGARVGLIGLAAIEQELSELLGRKADLRTPAELSPYFRNEVLAAARTEYAAS